MTKVLFEYGELKITQDEHNPARGMTVEIGSFSENVVVTEYMPAKAALEMAAIIQKQATE